MASRDSAHHYRAGFRLNKRANCTVWTTERKELDNYIHPEVIKKEYPAYSGTGQAFEDVPLLLAQAVHEASESGQPWANVLADTEKLAKKVSKAKTRLCNEFASKMTKDLLTKIDTKNEVRTWLAAIGEALRAA